MNRRNFLRSILGVAAATALPSEVWPFRKIFLPRAPELVVYTNQYYEWDGLARSPHSPLTIADIEAAELEFYKEEFPYLLRHIFPYDVEKGLYVVDGGMVENVMKEFNRGLDKVLLD